MVHCNKKTRRSSGFTMVELMVVLAIMAILAALVGGGLIAYTRLARFEKNEANARTLFQTAQIALTRRDTAGELDDFRQKVLLNGQAGAHFDPAALTLTGEENEEIRKQKADELNKNIYALYYDKVTDDDSDNELLRELLGDYIYDDSLLNAAICVEIDAASGQVYSVFYDTNADRLRFGKTDGATDIYNRSYDHRRHDSLVGYYSAEDRVNVVELQQTKLKVKNPRLSNTETLTLSWGGDVTRDTQVQYVATAYKSTDTGKKNPLFEIEVELPAVKTKEPVPLKTTIYSYNGGNKTEKEKTLYYPLSYNKGNFVLTLDAMASADLLRSCENDSGASGANSISVTDSSLYSITRLLSGGPQDFYVTLQAKARDGYSGSYTPSTLAPTSAENSLFAKEATATEGNLTYFRHLYNLRWADNWASGQTADYTLAAQSLGATGLNWTGGSVTVYCPAQGKNFPPEAKVPSAEEAVAWPTILTLPKNVTLDGGNITIMNLQLRGSSVSRTGRQGKTALLDRYIGLVGENNGTIKNMTLRDADVQVNVEIVTRAKGTLPLTGTTALKPLDTKDSAYRDIRAVGALCGVNTGTLENCTLTHGKNNAVSAQVLAMLPFDDNATAMARTTVSGTAYYENEPRGIGGLVGVAIPKNGQTQKISALTVDANVTVAGLLQDNDLKTAGENLTEQARYAAAASGENLIWRSIGVGGVVGTMDAAKLNLAAAASGKTITNKAAVIGSAFTGGVVGNLYNSNSSSADVTLTGLQNEGTVSVGANYLGSAEGKNSRVLGQFFGGIAGYCKDVTLRGSTSTTRRDMTETQLKTAVKGGYANDGALTDDSPLKGDFVGGLVGFASGCKLDNCTTQKGYVLGRCFVGGMAGGFSGSQLKITGGSNSSTVLGNRYVGGVVSVNGSQSAVSGVTNSGLVAGLGKNAAYVGGIAGLNDAEWGSTNAANAAATIQNCVSSMASDTATNSSRSALLQALSTYKNANNQETTTRADYVGGLVGRNGKNAVLTWDKNATTVQIGAVICGNDFVGGLVGCNDATAKITNTSTSLLTVSGEVVGGKAVGGMIGLNLAPALPAADIKVTEISGTLCVGGVIGANMPVAGTDGTAFTIKETATSSGKVSTFKTTAKAGRIKADGLAGGIIGYNCLLASAPTELTTILPAVAPDTGLVTVNKTLARSDKEMNLNGAANQFNLEVNAYAGGIVGYNDAATRLTISSATNGSDSNAASVGSLKMRGETGTLGSGVSLQDYNNSFNYNAYVSGKDARGYMAGGIIGCVTPKTELEGCTNYGIVSHKSAAGGIAGWNDGSIKNCHTYATLGTQQDGYAYLGGIVGINNGTVTDSAPAASITVRGRYIIGGVAGLNLTNASISYNNSNNMIPVTVQANECAGGVAGVNCGSIALGGTTLQVNITAESYAGGIAGSNNKRNDKAASIEGGNVTGTVTATKNYAGGAAGANYAEITGVALIDGACVRANDQFAGGIAGSNRVGTNGQIGTITRCTNNAGPNGNNYTVYATNGNAGGIAGSNESGAQIINAGVDNGVKIGVAKCDAAAIAANNFGIITGGTVGSCDITFAGESIGAVTAINNAGATISDVTLKENANIAFHGPATNVGGIAGKNAGTIGGCKVENPALALNGLTARADSISLGGAAGVNMQGATISGTNVTLNITDNLNKYKNLGGVAGENAGGGTLLKCTYQGALGQANTTGAANVLDTVGGIVGLNNGEVNGCSVPKITLQVMGASGLSDSQTYAEKLKSASSVGGIAGRNNSTITSCYVATGEGGGSIITARYGFVGGVAGANNGSISSSGSGAKEVTALVKQVGDWFTAGSTNDMISALKGTAYDSLKGVDTVSKNNYNNVYTATGLAKNDLLVGLRGTTDTNGKSSGYLGGVAGFNTVNGTITGAATGKWFVYGDNTTDESKIGGMIGMNEATGEVKLLVNCAAVRRFTRTDSNKNDDDTTYRDNKNIAYVGGVIGVQQNTADDKWVISECVNLGTVFDSGSNYIGGIIASWLKNGGTIEKSFNFGSLSTNTNSGGGSGTVGGIVGFFDQPTPGGTANILSCQNHGDILSCGNWEGNKTHGANDVAGILGKVVMADKSDYLRINIVDCVNGDVKMQCESLASGIMGWLGPDGSNVPDKVEVYIDRCRNYATDVKISPKSGETNLLAGICGNRGGNNSPKTSASTTVTNCFALYKNTVSTNNAPIAMNRGSENIVAYGNYFMDEGYSFNDAYNKAMKLMYEDRVKTKTSTYGASMSQESNYLYGTRLYAGINKSTGKYFAAGMVNNYNLNTVDAATCYIKKATNEGGLATIYRPDRVEPLKKEIATILLWYGNKDEISGPSMKDITDDLIQNYYTQVLGKRGPGQVSNLTVTHKNDSSAVYGRYEVTWTAAATPGIFPDNKIQNVSHYLVTLYKVDESGKKTALTGYQNIKVYGTRYLFDADDALEKAIGNSQFCVGVQAVNGTTPGAEEMSAAQYFVRPLPTPKLEIRLKKQASSGQPYGQYLVLTNASDYKEDAGNWQVTAYLMNQPNTEITLNASNTEAPIANGLGSATRLRATATPGEGATGAWMESARYDEEIGIPKTYYSGDKGGNSGLVHGTASINEPVITGSTADNLSITVTLQFTADTIFNTVPNYRVMLVGQYNGEETISNAAEGTAANAQPLKGQYVTLAAVEKPVYSSGTEFVLSNLPAVVFDGSYTDLKVISVPIDAGYPQVVTRWEITADEALEAIEKSNSNPVSWNNGIEIVRGADGKFSYYHLTPLQFFAENDPWYSISGFVTKQIRTDNLNLTLLKAPKVSSETTSNVDGNNKLNYTFTWTQPDENGSVDKTKHAYDVTLYGLLTEKDSETTTIADKEKIELKDGVSLADKTTFDTKTGTYTLTLCVDDDLASGSWRYDRVRLHVTRKPGDGDTNAIGLAGEADCTVKQRLSAVGQVNSIMRTNDNSANALNYDITWPASADAKGENTVTYTLYAEKLDSNNWTALADWKGITKNSCTVDLEKYQGVTLRFYVVANAVDGKKYCSPNGEYSNLLVVEKRLAAPVVTTAALSYQTPSQTQFLTEEKLTLTVKDASGGSYYYMGYLFKNSEDYTKIAKLASDWQTATNGTDDKAQKLAALTNALKDMLADTANPGRVLRLLPEGRMDGGAQAETTTDGAAFALGDESFTMKPEYAGYWLLPALRSMSTDGTTASSNWYYYVADGLSEAPTQMQLPKIKLDAPQTNQNAFTTVDSKATLQLFGADGETAWTPASTEADISRFAVEWNAVNYSKETGEGLADKYQLEITSADGNTTDKITFTVAERNVLNEDGTIKTKCGEILSVTKEVTIQDVTYTVTIPQQTEENGRTFYDLTTTVKTDEKGKAVLNEDGEPELTTNHVTLEGHYELKDASGTPRYKLETFATLEYLDRDGEPGYRVTLPDLVDLLHKDDTRQRITDKVTVLAEGDAEKTTQSEKLELTVPNDGTAAALTLTAEEQPTQDAAAEQSPAAAPPVLRAARVLRATPETAAAEKEELPAVG